MQDLAQTNVPPWWPHMKWVIKNKASEKSRTNVAERCAAFDGRWHGVSWDKLDYACRLVAVEAAKKHAARGGPRYAVEAIARCAELLQRAINGDAVDDAAWRQAAEAASEAEERADADHCPWVRWAAISAFIAVGACGSPRKRRAWQRRRDRRTCLPRKRRQMWTN